MVGSGASTNGLDQEGGAVAATSRPVTTAHATAFAGLLVLSLLPVLLVDIPAGADVPNHLARMTLLTQAMGGEESRYYEVTWALYPNLAMDLIVPLVAQATGAVVATKAFYVLSQLLLVSGAVAIELAYKRRFQISGYAALAYLYSDPFAWGFMNFAFGLGLGLWSVALFLVLRCRRWPVRAATHAVVVVVLFPAHFLALGLYGVAAGLIEVWRMREAGEGLHGLTVSVTWMAAPVGVVLALMSATGGAIGGRSTIWDFSGKLLWLLASVNGYSFEVSLVLLLGALAVLLVLVRARALSLEGPGRLLLLGFAVLYVVMPTRLLDTGLVDVRVVVAAALIVPAFVRLHLRGRDLRRGVLVAGVVLLLVNLSVVARAQLLYDDAYAKVMSSFRHVEPGARVLVTTRGEGGEPPANLLDYPMYHAPTLAAAARDALVPTLFTQPGKQPLAVREQMRDLDVGDHGVFPVAALTSAGAREGSGPPSFAREWQRDFDVVYVIGLPGSNPVPGALIPLMTSDRFTLYGIRPAG